MKTKTAVIIAIILIVICGCGAWFWLSSRSSTPSASKPTPIDSITPTVDLTILPSELDLAIVSKTLTVSVEADDNVGVIKVEYVLDGKVVARTIESPFLADVNLANLEPGEHTLQAVAYDAAGNKGTSKLFTFTLTAADISAANETSEQIIQASSRQTVRSSTKKTSSQSIANTASSANSGNGGGNNPGPTPDPERTAGGWWAALPQRLQVCSNQDWNDGPASAPAGAVIVPAGNNSGINFTQTNTTYWFASGVHTLGSGQFSQIAPGNNSTFIGAPGAIIDGQNLNLYAFTGFASNVRVAYLEIRNFGTGNSNNNEGVINHDAATGWTMEYINAHHNDGAAVFLGDQNTVQNTCLKDNGQYGFSMYKPPVEGDSAIKDIVIDTNEIVGNNQDDWESQIVGCGCTGAGKFWDVKGAVVTNNYVHGNLSTGLWADTNDIDFLFDSNWIEGNSGEGIWYEISYNATISRNVIKHNAWESGNNNLGSPGAAIYISESGGDSRLQSSTSGSDDLRINNNLIEDNFSGISIYENSNRFCNSNGNTSKTYCTPFVAPTDILAPYNFTYPNPISSTHPCYTNVGSQPYTRDCRWHSKDVQVYSNEFRFDDGVVPCAGSYCGVHALYATGDNNIPWAPSAYNIANVQNDVMFNNNNRFYNNAYYGDWRFAKGYGEKIYYSAWRSAPYTQDAGSTFNGATTPPPDDNSLDDNTATLEGTIGQWTNWYSATTSRSTTEAHSGSYSLKIDVTDPGGWGAQLANFPGYETNPGNKRVSFWARRGSGAISNVTMRVKWLDGAQQVLQTDNVAISSLSTTWQQGTLDVTAPATTTTVVIEFFSNSGAATNSLYADDFVIADR